MDRNPELVIKNDTKLKQWENCNHFTHGGERYDDDFGNSMVQEITRFNHFDHFSSQRFDFNPTQTWQNMYRRGGQANFSISNGNDCLKYVYFFVQTVE